MARLSSLIKIHIVFVSLLLINEPANKLVEGQLEAVGAVLSVVPVTSILATAGLMGVKLVALSRLLDMMGYDRAYLAQGGSGTAAHPIGLQTKYAYMFPYVPGLNISVRGEDSIGMQDTKVEAVVPQRKTYPAMGLPADYEHQQKPFRGSDTLQKILKQAGVHVHSPTIKQQQQLQQQFNLPPEGNDKQPKAQLQQQFRPQQAQTSVHSAFIGFDNSNSNLKPKDHNVIQPTYKDPIHINQPTNNNNHINNGNNHNNNDNHIINNNQNQNAHPLSNQPDSHQSQPHQLPRPIHSIPSNLSPHRHPLGDNIVHLPPPNDSPATNTNSNQSPSQPVSGPSSSSSQSTASSQAPLENNTNNNTAQLVDTATQVNNDPYRPTTHTHPTYHTTTTPMPSLPPTLSPPPPLWPLLPDSSISASLWSPPTASPSPSPLPSTPSQPTQIPASWMEPWLPSISASLWSPPTQSPRTTPTPTPTPVPSPSSWLPSSISASLWSPRPTPSASSSSPSSASWLPSTISAAVLLPSAPTSTPSSSPPWSPTSPPLSSTQSLPPMHNDFPSRLDESRPSLSSVHYGSHAVIPQRDEYIRQLMKLRRHRLQNEKKGADGSEMDKSLQIGHLSNPPTNVQSIIESSLAKIAPSPQPISAIKLVPSLKVASILQIQPQSQTQTQSQNRQHPNSATIAESHARIPQSNLNRFNQNQQQHEASPRRPLSVVPNSLRPQPGDIGGGDNRGQWLQHHNQQPQQQQQPSMATVADQQGNGFTGAPPHETTTNFAPRPFDLGDFPSTSSDDMYNEIDRMQQNRRRRKRSAATPFARLLFSRQTAALSSQPATGPAPQPDGTRSTLTKAQAQPMQKESKKAQQPLMTQQTFGMPALNIHSLRRRRRYSRLTGPGMLQEKLLNRSG